MKEIGQAKILAVDDNEDALYALEKILVHHGYTVVTAASGEDALAMLDREEPTLVLLDVMMPGIDGFAVTERIKNHPQHRFIPVVLVTARDALSDITTGLDRGADDYITKPFKPEELLARLRAVIRLRRLYDELQDAETRNDQLLTELSRRYDFSKIIGESPAMREVFSLVEKVAHAESPVLVIGPTGSGKELIARAIHYNSPRKRGPFVAQNCAAFNESLLESELFGHLRGSFTGAIRDKKGLFEAANGGTLFLDEIGEMSPSLQAKLLRVIQERTFIPVGSTAERKTDARIVAATNRDLASMARSGEFREDLYYRLNVITISLPSLAERREDIPLLVRHFLQHSAAQLGHVPNISEAALKLLAAYEWRGNVRELENEIERMLILGRDEGTLDVAHLSQRIVEYGGGAAADAPRGQLRDAVRKTEEELIRAALRKHAGNRSLAARELGISRSNLIAKVKQFELEDER